MPLSLFAVLVLASLMNPQAFLTHATALNDGILALFSNLFAFAGFLFLITCLWAALSPLGRVKIGGAKAVPLLSRWNWVAITLTTTIAIGIIFWGTAEPLYHLYELGARKITPASPEAAFIPSPA